MDAACQRALLLRDGRAVGVFRGSADAQPFCLVLEPGARCFTFADSRNRRLRGLTDCALTRLTWPLSALLEFRNTFTWVPHVPHRVFGDAAFPAEVVRAARWPSAWRLGLCCFMPDGSVAVSTLDRRHTVRLPKHGRLVLTSVVVPVSGGPAKSGRGGRLRPHVRVQQTLLLDNVPAWMLPGLALARAALEAGPSDPAFRVSSTKGVDTDPTGAGDVCDAPVARGKGAVRGVVAGSELYQKLALPPAMTGDLEPDPNDLTWSTTAEQMLVFLRLGGSAVTAREPAAKATEQLPCPLPHQATVVVDWTPSFTCLVTVRGSRLTAEVSMNAAPVHTTVHGSHRLDDLQAVITGEREHRAFELARLPLARRKGALVTFPVWYAAQHAGTLLRTQYPDGVSSTTSHAPGSAAEGSTATGCHTPAPSRDLAPSYQGTLPGADAKPSAATKPFISARAPTSPDSVVAEPASLRSSSTAGPVTEHIDGWGDFELEESGRVRVKYEDRALLYLGTDDRYEIVLPTGRSVAGRMTTSPKAAQAGIMCYLRTAADFRRWALTTPEERAAAQRAMDAAHAAATQSVLQARMLLGVAKIRKRFEDDYLSDLELEDCGSDVDTASLASGTSSSGSSDDLHVHVEASLGHGVGVLT